MKWHFYITFLLGSSGRFILILAMYSYYLLMIACEKKDTEPEESMPQKWIIQLPAENFYCSPALSLDEKTVYIGTSALPEIHKKNQYFIALDAATGKETWRIPLGISEVRSAPLVSSDSTISFTVEKRDILTGTVQGDELWHVSSEGSFLWKYDINPSKFTIAVGASVPASGPEGIIYVGGDKLYAIEKNGSLRWSFSSKYPEAIRNAPVVGNDGILYFAYHNIPLTAINPLDGSVLWSLPLGFDDHCFSSPALAGDGTIIVATQPGILYAVSAVGQTLWTFDIGSVGFSGVFRSSPSIGADGSIYFGLNTGSPSSAFFALNNNGTLKWIFEPGDLPDDVPSDHFDIYSSPAIGSDNVIYFGQEFGRVYALNATDGSVIGMATTQTGITWSSPAIDSKGVLYISDISGKVYALQTGSRGLDPNAQWPKFRFDNQNSGGIIRE